MCNPTNPKPDPMKLRTELEIAPYEWQIDHSTKIFSVGSCFADNVAARLAGGGFRVEANPFGVMFNPASVADTIERIASGNQFTESDFCSDGGRHFCYSLHGSFSSSSLPDSLARANRALGDGHNSLLVADLVIITLGTAWIYEREGRVVANCHKQPAAQFTRRKMSVEEIVERFCALIDGVLKGKRILFTVSPIRHLKDGLTENSLSKAILRVAIDELCRRYPDRCHYFPAYELLVDDLRDYRFYAEDMLHPSKQAVDYVWRKFAAATMDGHTLEGVEAAERYGRMVAHRIVDPTSPATAHFLENRYREREKLLLRWPGISLPSDE